jgi:hypothetical protein
VDPKFVPSELPRTQGVVPHGLFLRSHIHVEQTESQEKQETTSLIADPPPRALTSFGQRCLWHAATGLDCEVALVRSRARGTRTSAFAANQPLSIASQSRWQRDQHGCNQRETFTGLLQSLGTKFEVTPASR